MVVIAEDGDDRQRRGRLAGICKHGCLLWQPERRHVTGEQDDIGLPRDFRERVDESLAMLFRSVNVPRGRDANQRCHEAWLPGQRFQEPRSRVGARGMGYSPPEGLVDLVDAMKRAAGAFAAANVPVVLGGGLAAWARGGPVTDHDVDFFMRKEHVDNGLQALAALGMRTERPSEGWLVKAWEGEVLIDLIHHPAGEPVDDGLFSRATQMDVMAQPLLVASAGDVLAQKILALSEQDPDIRPVLEIARALREQVDWTFLRSRVEDTPFGAAMLTLVERLDIVPSEAAVGG
jgi:hypothetical protein